MNWPYFLAEQRPRVEMNSYYCTQMIYIIAPFILLLLTITLQIAIIVHSESEGQTQWPLIRLKKS